MSQYWMKAREPISSFTHMLGSSFLCRGNGAVNRKDTDIAGLVSENFGGGYFIWLLLSGFVCSQLRVSFF